MWLQQNVGFAKLKGTFNMTNLKPMQTIDLQCNGFTIEVYHDDNTLLCNGGFVFSDPDISKLYIVLGKHLLTVWQNKDFLT